jgi:hypothetical protein
LHRSGGGHRDRVVCGQVGRVDMKRKHWLFAPSPATTCRIPKGGRAAKVHASRTMRVRS